MRCRHRLSKLLLRHGIRFDDGDAWTHRHRQWLNEIVLEWPAAQATLLDVQGAIDALTHRRGGLERQIVSIVPNSPWRSQVGVMCYVGLVPCCESTTGQQRRLGSITKTDPPTPAGCWSKQRGTVAPGRTSAKRSPRARHQRHPVGWVGGGPARAGNPRQSYEQPAPRAVSVCETGCGVVRHAVRSRGDRRAQAPRSAGHAGSPHRPAGPAPPARARWAPGRRGTTLEPPG